MKELRFDTENHTTHVILCDGENLQGKPSVILEIGYYFHIGRSWRQQSSFVSPKRALEMADWLINWAKENK